MAQTNILPYLVNWNAPTFNGQPQEDVEMWISGIRLGLKQRHVPRSLWVEIAYHFLGEEPQAVLTSMKATMTKLEVQEEWDWERFTRSLIVIHEQVKRDAAKPSIGDDFHRFRKDHPYATAAAGLGLVTVGGITVAPAILVGTLNIIGFSASGVVSGSLAAGIQSAVYGGAVASGSLFAMAQSAAAGGVAVAPVALQALSAGTMALGAWVRFGRAESDTSPSPALNAQAPSLDDGSQPTPNQHLPSQRPLRL
ncbi:hypothetical protein B0H15DRAFT_386252 [Mycena belliarum]|uniref:Uncharacterized protein n=1 Tax=Mycena belliarum TaxID=1033014 RepID=A0AAD6U2D8_9AGAR|nr:hypothetical protein B0H15DRAFT_386252 [Mycena belliae]